MELNTFCKRRSLRDEAVEFQIIGRGITCERIKSWPGN